MHIAKSLGVLAVGSLIWLPVKLAAANSGNVTPRTMTYVNPVGARTGYHFARCRSERFGRRLRNIDVAAAVATFLELGLCGAKAMLLRERHGQ